MCAEHNPSFVLPFTQPLRKHIPQSVNFNGIGEGLDLFQHNGAHLSFIAGYGAGIAQTLQKFYLLSPNLWAIRHHSLHTT
jgi:hypothetical protein